MDLHRLAVDLRDIPRWRRTSFTFTSCRPRSDGGQEARDGDVRRPPVPDPHVLGERGRQGKLRKINGQRTTTGVLDSCGVQLRGQLREPRTEAELHGLQRAPHRRHGPG
jgi:hypothetical protein